MLKKLYFEQDTLGYSIVGNEKALILFHINPRTGEISLNRLLTQDTDENYLVRKT